MQEQKQSSPKLLKKGLNMSSPTLNKEKQYLPSRYALDPTKKDSNLQTLLNCISSFRKPSRSIVKKKVNWNFLLLFKLLTKTDQSWNSTKRKNLLSLNRDQWKDKKVTCKTSSKFFSTLVNKFWLKSRRRLKVNKLSWLSKFVKITKDYCSFKKEINPILLEKIEINPSDKQILKNIFKKQSNFLKNLTSYLLLKASMKNKSELSRLKRLTAQ